MAKEYTKKELETIGLVLGVDLSFYKMNKEEIIEAFKNLGLFVPRNGLMHGNDIVKEKKIMELFDPLHTWNKPPRVHKFGITFIWGTYSGVIYGRNHKYRAMWSRNKFGIWRRPEKGFVEADELVEMLRQAWMV